MNRLFVYGSLAPGCSNHHIMAPIAGDWQPAVLKGQIFNPDWQTDGGYPGVIPSEQGEAIEGQLFSSDELEKFWSMLDDFEGSGYERKPVKVQLAGGEWLDAFVYVLTDHSRGIRRANAQDVEAVRHLSRAAYQKWVAVIGREPYPMVADYKVAINEHLIDLYEIRGNLIALIEMIPKDQHLLIENIAVAPDYQGQGIGDLLLRHAEAVANEQLKSELRLYTNAAFTSNVTFYEKRGFVTYETGPIDTGGTVVHMRKTLNIR